MQRLFIGLVVAATTVLLPVWALAANQEVAERIAGNLREGGQLHDYKIGVKVQNGTVWLRGHVVSEDQLAKVLKLTWNTEGVDQVVNQIDVAPPTKLAKKTIKGRLKTPEGTLAPEQVSPATGRNPQRYSGNLSRTAHLLQKVVDSNLESQEEEALASQVEPLESSYEQQAARPVSAMTTAEPAVIPQSAVRPVARQVMRRSNRPVPVAYIGEQAEPSYNSGGPVPAYSAPMGSGVAPARYDQPCMPNYSWPSYAAHPNYAAVTYPKQYSPTAWPYIGPFYPYPQVPLGWRKVTLEWDDGWWQLDFKD